MPQEVKEALRVLENTGHLNLKDSMDEHPNTAKAKKVLRKFLKEREGATSVR